MSTLEPDPITRMSRDIANASKCIGISEARYLVDAYYSIQEYRKAAGNQVRALGNSEEPHAVIKWMFDQMDILEGQIKRALDKWTDSSELSVWAKSICGIGPVIAAGLAAHLDVTDRASAGKLWRFAGLDPTVRWNKGEKRPWNASLKTLCWKIGESFVKVSGNQNDVYGKIYLSRKAYEQARNEAGELADQAREKLERFKIGKDTEAYQWYLQGKLPPAHIHARAKRYAVKLFLSHYHHVAYRLKYGEDPPKPYVIALLAHADYVRPPGF